MAKKSPTDEWSKFLIPIQTPVSLGDQVYNNLLEAILSQQIKPGQHLVEQPLADQLSVSRISIREAIRRLAQDGLVEIIPTRGSYVVNLTSTDVEEIYRLRTSLECIAVEHIISQYQPGMLDVFDDILDDMRDIEQHEDRFHGAAVDNHFHRTLMHLSGLKRTIQIWEQMSNQITLVIYNVSNYYPTITGFTERHSPLLDLIRNGDAPNATRYLKEHIQEGSQHILKAMLQII
ncbi:MAG: GntR family transcriptional regulator [Anaerolineaceae bacterium]